MTTQIKDLESCVAYIREHQRKPNCILESVQVPRRTRLKIMAQVKRLSFLKDSPRPPNGDPEQWLWDERKALRKFTELRILGVLILGQGFDGTQPPR